MIEVSAVKEIVNDFLKNSESYLVEIEVKQGNIIVVEIDSDKAVSIDDCIALNRYIESHLDREIEDYELEVGSSGISQPFKLLRQYRKNIGKEVDVLLKNGKKLSGVLKAVDEKEIILTVEKQVKLECAKRKTLIEEDLVLTYEEIKYTKNIIRFK
ncbi:MAG: ribosome assembly cofactor RimP [Dysgonamonadaceae bacterium]|jgi:ribosome maturation factor RimP|nr:ribosome assembly cofactor RimP [Dysgonamonadaceae bacterium]